ncbi:MAG: FAD:protein FMN transferase, partial [Alistipes dispar]
MLKKNLCGLFAALFAAGFAGCGGGPRTYTVVDGTMLGTTLHVVADVEGVSSQELYAAAMELDREAKASMSIFDPASLLSRLNRNETDSVDRHIAFNLRLADSIGALSGGRYDVTVKPLVEAWGFAGKAAQAHPNVDSILDFVGREKVRIERGRLVK